jgi:hypothetical protein
MQDVVDHLERLRRRARWLLLVRRLGQVVLAAVVGVVLLVGLDYVLRLPGVVRLVVGVSSAVVWGWWSARGLREAAGGAPRRVALAQRAERLFPAMQERLAAAVDLAGGAGVAEPAAVGVEAALARRAVSAVQTQAEATPLGRVLDRTPAMRAALLGALALSAGLGAAALSPGLAAIGLGRWVAPLGEVQWPRRVTVELLPVPEVVAADGSVTLGAAVVSGYRPGLQASFEQRFSIDGEAVGPWERYVVEPQSAGGAEAGGVGNGGRDAGVQAIYELLVQPPAAVRSRLAESGGPGTLEYRVAVGDDRSEARRVTVAARPRWAVMRATVRPPGYAVSLPEQRLDLLDQPGPVLTLSGYRGSTLRLELGANKALAPRALRPGAVLPGFAGLPGLRGEATDRGLVLELPLREDAISGLRLADELGLSSQDRRQLAIRVMDDQLPRVELDEPAVDTEVLATAAVRLAAAVSDDLGVAAVRFEVGLPGAEQPQRIAERSVPAGASGAERVEMEHTLELSQLGVAAGQVVELTAAGRDHFELDGQRHPWVHSPVRRLRVVTPEQMSLLLQRRLAGVRGESERQRQQQRAVSSLGPGEAQRPQARIGERLGLQARQVRGVGERMQMNRLDDPSLAQLIDQAGALLDEAGAASGRAGEAMAAAEAAGDDDAARDAAEQQVDEAQQQVDAALRRLSALLDQGAAAAQVRAAVQRITADQAALSEELTALLPRVAGRSVEQLDAATAEQVQRLAERQAALAGDAEAVVRTLQSTSQVLTESGGDQDLAAAEAMQRAATAAQQRGLSRQMREASQRTGEGRASQAAVAQQAAGQTLREMAEALGQQQELLEQRLRRRLVELAERVERLVEEQGGLNEAAGDMGGGGGAGEQAELEARQTVLRRQTMAARAEATEQADAAVAVAPLGRAVAQQAEAVLRWREAQGAGRAGAAAAGGRALGELEEALRVLREQQQDTASGEQQQQRAQLRSAYLELAGRQQALRERVEAVVEAAGGEQLDRRQRRDVRRLAGDQDAAAQPGEEQSDTQASVLARAAELGEQASGSAVFQLGHERVDRAGRRAVEALRGGEAGGGVVGDQARVEATLRAMAQAMDQRAGDERFDGADAQQAGGGGGGGQPPLVPPMAQLRLLRSLQAQLYEQTRASAGGGAGDDGVISAAELGEQQRRLAELAEQLVRELERQMEAGSADGAGDRPEAAE